MDKCFSKLKIYFMLNSWFTTVLGKEKKCCVTAFVFCWRLRNLTILWGQFYGSTYVTCQYTRMLRSIRSLLSNPETKIEDWICMLQLYIYYSLSRLKLKWHYRNQFIRNLYTKRCTCRKSISEVLEITK